MLTGPRRRPTWKEICEQMLCGNGGLCTIRNPFLKVLLAQQGFETFFVSASMEEPDCHIGILVRLNEVDYWLMWAMATRMWSLTPWISSSRLTSLL